MANLLTPLALVNQAYRNLGELPITSFTDTLNPKSVLASLFYAPVRDDLFAEHFWNFATRRVVLRPYSEPDATLTPGAVTGDGILFTTSETEVFGLDAVGKRLVGDGVDGEATIAGFVTTRPVATLTPAAGALTPGTAGVTFTASAIIFTGVEVGRLIENLEGNGVALITSVTDTTHVVATIQSAWDSVTAMASQGWQIVKTDQVTADITEDFADLSAIAAGEWRLYNQSPDWGAQNAMSLPSDYIRVQRVGFPGESLLYQREGEYFVTDEDTLPLTYTALVSDVTKWPPAFVQCYIAKLAAEFCGQIADLTPKRDLWLKLADMRLRKAKKDDGQEGSAPQLTASDLIIARRGGRSGWPRSRF